PRRERLLDPDGRTARGRKALPRGRRVRAGLAVGSVRQGYDRGDVARPALPRARRADAEVRARGRSLHGRHAPSRELGRTPAGGARRGRRPGGTRAPPPLRAGALLVGARRLALRGDAQDVRRVLTPDEQRSEVERNVRAY